MRIALAGNPNSGKTTMYNALTGKNEHVGNWAGVTVEKNQSELKSGFGKMNIDIIDLPGAYSMSPFTSEETITSDYIKTENPDVIINIVDATNLSRSLFFTTQLLELSIPVVVALNKTDVSDKKHNEINAEELALKLGCPVVKTVSTNKRGLKELIDVAVNCHGKRQQAPFIQANVDLSNKQAVFAADKKRFDFVNSIVEKVENRETKSSDFGLSDKIDEVLTNKWVGIPIFAAVMFAVFWISQAGPGVWLADWLTALLEEGQALLGSIFSGANELLYALLIDGVVGGVIAVIGFLPLVMVMYFLIALLEDCGYMARVSVVLDPIFKRVGLSGKSVIPFVIGTGCSIPGVMACRTIRDERERRATAMLAPFMPCGAKLPVIALFARVFFNDATWVGPLMYFAGIVIIFLGALLVNKVAAYKPRKSFFIIELPEYKAPSLVRAFNSMCSRGWAYIVKAATIILLCNTLIQLMQSFTLALVPATSADSSILALIARPFAYLIAPVVGIVSWELAAAAITGFIAKENVVGTLAVCFSITNFINVEELILESGAAEVAAVMGIGPVAALAYLMFNLFTPPCFAAIGAMNSEMKSAKWLWGGLGLQFAIGFTVAFLVYSIGTLITNPASLGIVPAICGFAAILVMAGIIAAIAVGNNKKLKEEYELRTA